MFARIWDRFNSKDSGKMSSESKTFIHCDSQNIPVSVEPLKSLPLVLPPSKEATPFTPRRSERSNKGKPPEKLDI